MCAPKTCLPLTPPLSIIMISASTKCDTALLPLHAVQSLQRLPQLAGRGGARDTAGSAQCQCKLASRGGGREECGQVIEPEMGCMHLCCSM